MLGTVLLILLVLLLLGGLMPFGGAGPVAPGTPGPYYHGYGFGLTGGGVIGAILVVMLIVVLLGYL
jgi:hypothetical protein